MRETRLDSVFTASGAAVLAGFVCAFILLLDAPYHTDRRFLGQGVLAASGCLEIGWTLLAVLFLAVRRRATSLSFRTILAVNGVISALLVYAA
jgi:hypothetical protein